MAIYKVSTDTCIFVNPKAGSHSMHDALSTIPHSRISIEEAAELDIRVVFIRNPIERLNSLFNMFYWYSLSHTKCDDFLPEGTITAHGHRVAGFVGDNEKHWKGARIERFKERLAAKRGEGEISDEDLIRWLDHKDYKTFIDFVLSNTVIDHWSNQVDLCSHNDVFVPNRVHSFSNMQTLWSDYIGGTLPHLNSWRAIEHGVYRLADIKSYYAKDIQKLRSL